MEQTKRVEIAERIAGASKNYSPRVWTKTTESGEELVRVYTSKGYAVVDKDGDVDIDELGRSPFGDVKEYCDDNGIKTYRKIKTA